jgi:hypothetical protein
MAEFVVNLGTWVIRIEELIKGIAIPFQYTFEMISSVVSWALDKISGLLDYFGLDIDKLGGNLETLRS